MAKVKEMQDEYAWLLEQFPQGRPVPQAAREIRWMIEELRVSYFAHALGTAYPVSDKRIVKAVDAAAPWPRSGSPASSSTAPPDLLYSLVSQPAASGQRNARSCGAVWSARHPVKVEAAGSNPVRTASFTARIRSDAGRNAFRAGAPVHLGPEPRFPHRTHRTHRTHGRRDAGAHHEHPRNPASPSCPSPHPPQASPAGQRRVRLEERLVEEASRKKLRTASSISQRALLKFMNGSD